MSRISIHAPREGGDDLWIYDGTGYSQFQSTPPARGATAGGAHHQLRRRYFNPRPPRGGRLRRDGLRDIW